jgi:uncharacterized Zn finger protein
MTKTLMDSLETPTKGWSVVLKRGAQGSAPSKFPATLEEKYPAAASLLYRRMVESVLNRGSSKQYPYAAEDLQSCCRLAERVAGDNEIESHATFLARLKKAHGRKYGFWSQFDGRTK